MNNTEIFEKLEVLVKEGCSYDNIRKKAIEMGLQNQALKETMREIDTLILEREEENLHKSDAWEWMGVGLAIIVLSAVMLLYTQVESFSNFIYIVYATLFGGVLIFISGLRHHQSFKEDEKN